MATSTAVLVTDDLDGTPNASTVAFSFEGKAYEIDLNKKNAAAFAKLVQPYLDAARRAPSTARRLPGRRKPPTAARTRGVVGADADLSTIRTWAAENGIAVAARGRISTEVREQYAAAH